MKVKFERPGGLGGLGCLLALAGYLIVAFNAMWIRCDGCDEQIPADLDADSVGLAREVAKRHGWRRRGRQDFCPNCLRYPPGGSSSAGEASDE